MNSKGLCAFNKNWLQNPEYAWVKQFKGDKRKALCTACDRLIDISSMAESALKSHTKGVKHKMNYKNHPGTIGIESFFSKDDTKQETTEVGELNIPPPPTPTASSSSKQLGHYFTNDTVLKAEVLWMLRLVTSHQSYKSSENSSKLFLQKEKN